MFSYMFSVPPQDEAAGRPPSSVTPSLSSVADNGRLVLPPHPEDNQTSGTPRPVDKPADQYITSEDTPSMDRSTPGVPPMDNPGDYSKKFA